MKSSNLSPRLVSVLICAILGSTLGLTGCFTTFSNPNGLVKEANVSSLAGKAFGGRSPINGAHIYMYAANTSAYGAASNSLVLSYSGGSFPSTIDTNGNYYITTSANGSFYFSAGEYACTAGTQVYLLSVGGNPGDGVNSAATLMAVVGQCQSGGSFTGVTAVKMNEVSTVAAAYALSGFSSDPTHVASSGTTLAQTGIANAFATAANLYDINGVVSPGLARTTTVAGNGTVPQTEINALANSLAACVNTTSSSSPACTLLFQNSLSGGATGTQPTDTATAAINIAHHPGYATTTIFNVSPSIGQPYNPTLSNAPNDFTIAINYTGGGINAPRGIAIDASGNVWVSNFGGNTLTELTNTGAAISSSSGYSGGGLNSPFGIAIDTAGNAWTSDFENRAISEFSSSGVAISPTSGFTGGGLSSPHGIAIDSSGNVWTANQGNSSISEFSSAGTALSSSSGYTGGGLNLARGIAIDTSGSAWIADFGNSTVGKFSSTGSAISSTSGYTGGGLNGPAGIAVDSAGNLWTAGLTNTTVSKFNSSGTAISSSSGYTGGGLNAPRSVAIDSSGNAWLPNFNGNTLSEFSSSGTAITSTQGYGGGNLSQAYDIAIDGSGNAWIANSGNSSVTQFVGIAAPVVTPLVQALINNNIAGLP